MSVVYCENKDRLVDLDYECDRMVVDKNGKWWMIDGPMDLDLDEEQRKIYAELVQ